VNDEPQKGVSYKDGTVAKWCLGIGEPKNLGLLLKVAPQTLSKKNMLTYWDTFGEVFGMPIRVVKLSSRDPQERAEAERMMRESGALTWALLPAGSEIELKETSRGDVFNVYDRRVERCNSEMSKIILGQTMTTDNGSSHSQAEVHLKILENIIFRDADFIRDIVNRKLIPFLLMHGFPVKDMRFDWNESIDWTPEQQIQIEQMLINSYEIDPKYFVEKYNIPVIGVKSSPTTPLRSSPPTPLQNNFVEVATFDKDSASRSLFSLKRDFGEGSVDSFFV
jgi:hypothetical protein